MLRSRGLCRFRNRFARGYSTRAHFTRRPTHEEPHVGIRETLNQNPKIVTGVTAAIIVIALVFIFWPSSGGASGDGSGATGVGKAFYSSDDGQHWFQDDVHKLPP